MRYSELREDVEEAGCFSNLINSIFPCLSSYNVTDEQRTSLKVDRILESEHQNLSKVIKLLLLGSGDSGKSTINKQLKIIHHKGYNARELEGFKEFVYANTLTSIIQLVNAMKLLNIEYEKMNNIEKGKKISKVTLTEVVTKSKELLPLLWTDIKDLWEDKGIQIAYEQGGKFNLLDSAKYFLDQLERISNPRYNPTQQDVLRTRKQTSGVVETDFTIERYKFKLVDVGGQRSERKKWIHAFAEVTAVIFVTSLSEYDQKTTEDSNQNRMWESIILFDEICNLKYFKNTSMIIFFNKDDIFREKIQKVNLNVCFPDYKGGLNYQAALNFIIKKFLEVDKRKDRQIYTSVTCATDTKCIKVVFDVVKNIILHKNLIDNNLL